MLYDLELSSSLSTFIELYLEHLISISNVLFVIHCEYGTFSYFLTCAFFFPSHHLQSLVMSSDIFLWKCVLYVFQQWIKSNHLLHVISTRLLFILSLFPIIQYSSGI